MEILRVGWRAAIAPRTKGEFSAKRTSKVSAIMQANDHA